MITFHVHLGLSYAKKIYVYIFKYILQLIPINVSLDPTQKQIDRNCVGLP